MMMKTMPTSAVIILCFTATLVGFYIGWTYGHIALGGIIGFGLGLTLMVIRARSAAPRDL